MVSKNNNRTISAALALTLLSVSMASMIVTGIQQNVSAQGLPESSETQQGGQEVPRTQEEDMGIVSLNDTTGGQPGGGVESSPCTPSQVPETSLQNATGNTTTAGSSGTLTINNTIMLGDDGVASSPSQIRDHIEQACIALKIGDTQGALMQLNFILDELGASTDEIQGNNSTTSSSVEEGSFNEAVNVGGTGPFDDYDATPDAEGG
jgi:hypothetical protein